MLTIGIPSYNGGSHLPALLESIKLLKLGRIDYEILVVDNNSSDDTDEVIEQLKVDFEKLRYHKNELNIGRIENWNKVIDLAQGEYLIIMNVNDRFLDFNLGKYIRLLNNHKEVSMVMTDVTTDGKVYPGWGVSGTVCLNNYLERTFLDPRYFEFNSLGVLHQHIFRTNHIRSFKIRFNSELPRTTDRVFTAELIQSGGGVFYYVARSMVAWYPNKNRYHHSVHNEQMKNIDFKELWIDEYEANLRLAGIGNLDVEEFFGSQLIFARSLMFIRSFQNFKNNLIGRTNFVISPEILTASDCFAYLKDMASLNNFNINYPSIKRQALIRAIRESLTYIHPIFRNSRTLELSDKEIEFRD